MESQTDSPSAVEEVLEVRNYVKNISGTLKKILKLVEASSGQMNLTSFVVSELNVFVLSSKKSLDVLESEFELFEITHIDKRDQLKSWLKMLLVFQEYTSCSLENHLRLTCDFGKELITNLRAGILSSETSELLKALLIEIKNNQTELAINLSARSKNSSHSSSRQIPKRNRMLNSLKYPERPESPTAKVPCQKSAAQPVIFVISRFQLINPPSSTSSFHHASCFLLDETAILCAVPDGNITAWE